jgi:hypothetical protein
MPPSPYERLHAALRHELQLSPEREFETLLAKAKLHASAQGIRLSQSQHDALFGIYFEAKHGVSPQKKSGSQNA